MKCKLPKFALVALLLQIGSALYGQQDPMFTKYFFNTLVYNPAYAGSKEYLSIVALAREQWVGWNQGLEEGKGGAPGSQTFTLHAPWHDRVGWGLSISNDRIGATKTTGVNAAYAYRVPFGKAKLSLGINAGAALWRADWSHLNIRDNRDPNFSDPTWSRWIPTVGAGLFFYSDDYYFGFSVPRLFNYNLRNPDDDTSIALSNAQVYRHFYFTAGGAIPVKGDDLIFKPSMLIKSVGLFSKFETYSNIKSVGAPTEFEVDLSMLFYRKFWAGVAFRSAFEAFNGLSSSDSFDAWVSFYLNNGFRIGAAYDFPVTTIRHQSVGSFELMLGYDFDFKVDRILTPRYF